MGTYGYAAPEYMITGIQNQSFERMRTYMANFARSLSTYALEISKHLTKNSAKTACFLIQLEALISVLSPK